VKSRNALKQDWPESGQPGGMNSVTMDGAAAAGGGDVLIAVDYNLLNVTSSTAILVAL